MVHGRYMYLVNGVQNPPADNVWPPCYKLDYKPSNYISNITIVSVHLRHIQVVRDTGLKGSHAANHR
jgi:hypothetical protein